MKQYHHIVITTGISLFSSMNVYGKWVRNELTDIFRFKRTNPIPSPEHDEESALQSWKNALQSWKNVLAHLDIKLAQEDDKNIEDFKNISAEYSLLYALQTQKRLSKFPKVVLIYTDTLGGKAAFELLRKVLPHSFGSPQAVVL